MEKTVLLDTSFVVACAEFRIDYFSEFSRTFLLNYKVSILDKVLSELEHLCQTGSALKKQSAKLAKTVLEKKKVFVLKTESNKTVDDILVSIADKDTIIATIDAELKRRLKKLGVAIVFVRQKKYLQVEGLLQV